MFNFNKSSKSLGLFSGALLLVTLPVSFSPSAVADGKGAGGDGHNGCVGGGCSIVGPFYWKVIQSDGAGSAFDKFVGDNKTIGLSGISYSSTMGNLTKQINPLGGDTRAQFLEKCKTSKYIWWVSSSTKLAANRPTSWAWNYPGVSYPAITTNKSNPNAVFTGAVQLGGAKLNSDFTQVATDFIDKAGSNHPVIICSDLFKGDDKKCVPGKDAACTPQPKDPCKENPNAAGCKPPSKPKEGGIVSQTEEREEQMIPCTGHYDEPYEWKEDVKLGLESDFVGKPNLHDQTFTRKTNYGKILDDVKAGKKIRVKCEDLKKQIETAIQKDKKDPHITTDFHDKAGTLDDANKQGMSEGGVLDFYEYKKKGTIDLDEELHQERRRTCTTSYSTKADGSLDLSSGVRTCGPWSDWRDMPVPPTVRVYKGVPEEQPQPSGFWQMISVHCNKKGFEYALNAANSAGQNATVVQANDPDNYISAVAVTKKVDKKPDTRVWGEPEDPTGQKAFYDKECSLSCKKDADPAGGKKDSSGKYGAQGNEHADPATNAKETLNSNKFIFFRDNQDKFFNVDVWRPTNTSLVNASNSQNPISTTITRWPLGTPGLRPGDNGNGGEWHLYATQAGDKEVFDASHPGLAPTQRNFEDPQPWNYAASAQFPGTINKFKNKATWASDDKAPEVLNFKWEFEPNIKSTIYTKNVGFDNNGERNTGTATAQVTPIQGKCFAEFGQKNTTLDLKDSFMNNTGTNTFNNQDGNLLEGFHDAFNGDDTAKASVYLKFVRATTE